MGKVPLIALTATATKSTRLKIMRSLEMHEPALLMDSPNRHNICYAVRAVTPDPAKTFQIMVENLRKQKGNYERTIIYCQTIKVTTFLYGFFLSELGDDVYADDSCDLKKRTVEMSHSRIDELNQEHILESMSVADGSVRVLLATIAYGMGINCKDVKVVLHYGPSYNLETYLQESGRAGRNVSATCKAVMLYSSLMMKYCEEEIKTYARNSSKCRRKMLLESFDVDVTNLPSFETPHQCCDNCQTNCKCQGDSCDFVFFPSPTSEMQEASFEHSLSREVSDGQRETLRRKLNYLKVALDKQYLCTARSVNNPMFTPAKLYCALGDAQIDQVLNNCAIIFTSADIFKFVDIWHLSVAKEILFTFNQVFCDVDVTESEEPENDNTLECVDEDFFHFDVEDSLFAGLPDDFYIVEDSLLQHGPGEEELDSDLE